MSSHKERIIRPRHYYIGALALILVGLVIGLGLSAGLDLHRTSTGSVAASTTTPAGFSGPLESPFVPVVQKTLPAVVFVDVKKKVGEDGDQFHDDLMQR